MESDRAPSLNKGCWVREIEGQAPSIQIPEGMLRMTGAGLEIVKLCDGKRTVSEIVACLQARYPAEMHARIEDETRAFLTKLARRSVLSPC